MSISYHVQGFNLSVIYLLLSRGWVGGGEGGAIGVVCHTKTCLIVLLCYSLE